MATASGSPADRDASAPSSFSVLTSVPSLPSSLPSSLVSSKAEKEGATVLQNHVCQSIFKVEGALVGSVVRAILNEGLNRFDVLQFCAMRNGTRMMSCVFKSKDASTVFERDVEQYLRTVRRTSAFTCYALVLPCGSGSSLMNVRAFVKAYPLVTTHDVVGITRCGVQMVNGFDGRGRLGRKASPFAYIVDQMNRHEFSFLPQYASKLVTHAAPTTTTQSVASQTSANAAGPSANAGGRFGDEWPRVADDDDEESTANAADGVKQTPTEVARAWEDMMLDNCYNTGRCWQLRAVHEMSSDWCCGICSGKDTADLNDSQPSSDGAHTATLPCTHAFHTGCMARVPAPCGGSFACPLCRRSFALHEL